MPWGARTITGEKEGIFSLLHISDGAVLHNALELWLKRSDVASTFENTSSFPASQAALYAWITALLQEYRRTDVPLAMTDISGLVSWISSNFRLLLDGDFSVDLRYLDFDNTMTSVRDKFANLQAGRSARAPIQYFPEHHSTYSPSVTKHVRRWSNIQSLTQEYHFQYNVSRAAPEYSLALGDGSANAVYDGRISLLRAGQVIQTINFLPPPANQAGMLLSVDSGETLFYENAGSHTAAHGSGGSGGTGDGLIGSLDFLSDTGNLRAITTTGVTVTTPQSLDDRYYSRSDVDALLLPLQQQVVSLTAQILGLSLTVSSQRLHVRDASGNYQPVSRLSADSGSMAMMYTGATDHLHVWVGSVSPPLDSPN